MQAQSQNLVTGQRFNFGRFSAPFAKVNPLDAEPFGERHVPKPLKSWRLKEWQAFQFASERYFVNVALFNAKIMALVQIKIYDRQAKRKFLFERKVSPLALRAPMNLLDSDMAYKGRGCRMQFQNRLAQDHVAIDFDVAATGDCPALSGKLRILYAGQQPLVVAIPFGDNHGMYSQKGLAPVEGTLAVAGETTRLSPTNAYALMDDHRGYYPWVMRWDWLTGGTFLDDGRLFGFNLTRNDSTDPERYNENAFWLAGQRYDLPAVTFTRSKEAGGEIWRVRDAHGQVAVDFKVEVEGNVDINAVVIRSKYRGPFGTFSGYVAAKDGPRVPVDGIFGMGEDFYLRC